MVAAESDFIDSCLWCGGPLPQPRHWERLWCGRDCQRAARAWRLRAKRWGGVEEIADCRGCGARFERVRPWQQFCSKHCGIRHWHQAHASPLLPRACEGCGREFTPKANRRARCCSDACIKRRRKKRLGAADRKKVDYLLRACSLCGAEYKPPRHDSRTCSPDCAREWQAGAWRRANRR